MPAPPSQDPIAAPKTLPSPRRGLLVRPAGTLSFVILIGLGAVASALALIIGARPLFELARSREQSNARSALDRSKAGRAAGIRVVIVPPLPRQGPERVARGQGVEPVASGERLRIGIEPGPRQFTFVLSVDERGRVVPWYPEFGVSLPAPESGTMQDLPDLFELSGHGLERLIVLLSSEPLELDGIRREIALSLARVGGDITRMPNLATAGDQFHRLLVKR
jgi:hypothetical protein